MQLRLVGLKLEISRLNPIRCDIQIAKGEACQPGAEKVTGGYPQKLNGLQKWRR